MNIPQNLKERFPKIRQDEPLKNHCTMRVGGPADLFYELYNIEELPDLVAMVEENAIAYKVIGRGTNMLFTDKGFRGLIIKNLSNQLSINGTRITADSGVLLAQVVRLSVENNLTGLEPLYGLPGSVGAAIWGNAGIPGTELSMFIHKITIFNAADGLREIGKSDIAFSYRKSSLQGSRDLVMRVEIDLPIGKKDESKEHMKQIDIIRRGKQPIGYSAGSFFKNPSKEKAAGYLIDQAGLKGARVGDAQISEKHGNFFMNMGNATASEILELANIATKSVKEKFGIELEMEVKVVGEK